MNFVNAKVCVTSVLVVETSSFSLGMYSVFQPGPDTELLMVITFK